MKAKKYIYMASLLLLMACGNTKKQAENSEENALKEQTQVVLTDEQVKKVNIEVGHLTEMVFENAIEANGKLVIDPQSEATVTPQTGGNIKQILVKEGQIVAKGQIIAYLSHPDFVNLQTQYLSSLNQQKYLSKEFARQAMMMKEGVGAGKDYDRIKSELKIVNGELQMLSAQLRQMGINPSSIRKGNPKMTIAIKSPIRGTVEQIDVQTGQYTTPEMPIMKIVNTDNIFAELQVFLHDISKIKVGQSVQFKQSDKSGKNYRGKVYSIGKTFNNENQTVDVRVNIMGDRTGLIGGMYIQAQIATNAIKMKAVPYEAIAEKDGKFYIYKASHQGSRWQFFPVGVKKIKEENGFVAIEPLEDTKKLSNIAQSGAYYLLSEMNKGETGEE